MGVVIDLQAGERAVEREYARSPISLGGADADFQLPGLAGVAANLSFDDDEVWLSVVAADSPLQVDGRHVRAGMNVLIKTRTVIGVGANAVVRVRRKKQAAYWAERFGPSAPVMHMMSDALPVPPVAEASFPDGTVEDVRPSPGSALLDRTVEEGTRPIEASVRRTTPLSAQPVAQDLDELIVAPGARLGNRYELVRKIGSGGMGSVYEAIDRQFDDGEFSARVAIKLLGAAVAGDEDARERFKREASLTTRLRNSDHAVKVFDFGVDRGVPYLVMELLKGQDLGRRLAEKTISRQEALDAMLPICDGVHTAHEKGIVHRDLKPQNVFLIETAVKTDVKILDFGISVPTAGPILTKPGMIVGTWHYISPEQAQGMPADSRSDQYAMGVMLYEIATGRHPFPDLIPAQLFSNIAEGRFTRPIEVDPTISAGLELVILQAMAKNPADRYPSVHLMGAALLPFVSSEARMRWSKNFSIANPHDVWSIPNRREPRVETPARPASISAVADAFPSDSQQTAAPSSRDRRLMIGMAAVTLATLAVLGILKFARQSATPVPDATSAGAAQ